MTEIGGFWLLPEKVFKQFNSNLVCTLIGWVLRNNLLLVHVGQILGPLVVIMTENGTFWPISEKGPLCGIMNTQSISNRVYTLVKEVFTNRPHRLNLAPLVTISVFPFPLIRPQGGGHAFFSDALFTLKHFWYWVILCCHILYRCSLNSLLEEVMGAICLLFDWAIHFQLQKG